MDAELVIIGGGPAGTSVLAALSASARAGAAWRGRVVVIERTESVGTGLPFGEAAAPEHTLGRVTRRRRDVGRALGAQFQRACDELAAGGARVLVQRGVSAQALHREAGGWRVQTDRESDPVRAERVVLGTGPWHVERLAHVTRAVDWRWDVRRLHARVRDDEDVLVLGTSQSAVDIAIALGARRQRAGSRAKIVLASRRGLLPSVWGPIRASRVPPGGAKQLDALRARPAVRLREMLDAVRADIAALGATPCEDPEGAPWPGRDPDGVETLRRDLARARDATYLGREIAWQAVLFPTVPAVFDLFPRLCAEDRLALAPRWSQYLRYLEAIHAGAAAQIVELADAGLLEVRALGETVALGEDARGVYAAGPLGAARGDRVIDARGHDPRIERSDDAFLRAVLAAGHAASARVPFRSPPGALDPSDATAPCEGRPHLITGGLWVDPATFRVRDEAGRTSPSLYALGPLTMGQYPVYLGLWALRTAAARIAADLAGAPAGRGVGERHAP